MISEILTRLRFLVTPKTQAEVDDELRCHLEHLTEAYLAAGMPPEQASRQAVLAFGGVERAREQCREQRPGRFMETIVQDVRYGLRTLRKDLGFTTVVILTLALGIGANTAMFSVIRTVLLKPLEYRDPERLMRLVLAVPRRNVPDQAFNEVRFEEMRSAAHSFSELGVSGPLENLTLSGGGEPEVVNAARVSANFLTILGTEPLLGRSFLPEEDRHGGPPVAMISSELWRRRFNSDPQVVGKPATLDAVPYTIIGVLPARFAFPVAAVDLWVTRPSEWSALPSGAWRTVGLLKGFARLKPEVSLEQARAEMGVLQQRYALAHPNPNDADPSVTMGVVPLRDQLVANVRPMLWILLGAVGFLLLIACANVASLSLARATSRSREFALRAAIGATRRRLVGQLLAESLLLAVAGGAGGVLLAKWSLHVIGRMDALNLPRAAQIRLDGVVLGFVLVVSITTGVLFGLFPSLSVSRPNLAGILRGGFGAAGQGASRFLSARALLVVGQVALSTVLVIGAALLLQSFARLHTVDPGFRSADLLTVRLALPRARYDTDAKKEEFFQELVRRMTAIPGVRSAAAALSLPTKSSLYTNIMKVEGVDLADEDYGLADMQLQSITPGYFQTLGIPLRLGRVFTEQDNAPGAPPVVVLNESLARLLWPDYPRAQDPIGRHIWEGADREAGELEIVGVVGDVHEGGLTTEPRPEFYVPLVVHPPQRAYLAVRTQGDSLGLANAIRSQVLAIDGDQAVSDIHTMEEVIDESVGQRLLTMMLVGTFAGVALLLAIVGIFGLVAYSAARRTQEVGIRRALGAQQGDILRLVVSQGLALALCGVVLGVVGAFALTRVMKEFLFQMSATDPPTFLGVALLFVLVALAASFIPARRAARGDPMIALRVG
jgi:putative ABC transport system permease protein